MSTTQALQGLDPCPCPCLLSPICPALDLFIAQRSKFMSSCHNKPIRGGNALPGDKKQLEPDLPARLFVFCPLYALP